ncbi:MAG: hypothetical protein RJA76_1679 [Bacteroidota bacterium]|jgi:hypothetical protein
MKKSIKILGWTFSVIFLLFAYWQLNDPDPIIWIPPYLIASYVAYKASQFQFNQEVLILATLMSFAAGLQIWTTMDAWEGFITDGLSMKTRNQELAREAVGLWISTFSYILFFVLNKLK